MGIVEHTIWALFVMAAIVAIAIALGGWLKSLYRSRFADAREYAAFFNRRDVFYSVCIGVVICFFMYLLLRGVIGRASFPLYFAIIFILAGFTYPKCYLPKWLEIFAISNFAFLFVSGMFCLVLFFLFLALMALFSPYYEYFFGE